MVGEEGYTVEIRIPFQSIRFANTDRVEMGIIFERNITRYSAAGTYPPLDPAKGGNFLTEMQPMSLEDIERSMLLEVLPAITYSQRSELDEDKLVRSQEENDVSLTLKYGIKSDLVLDGTVNPDFSQVESDVGQIDINLRSPLFFPEKRPFFLEGREHFNFAGPSSYNPLQTVVHTRNIVNPLAGVKVFGKLGGRSTIASIVARDDSPVGGDNFGEYADFAIFRYKHALEEDSFIGGFYTGRERESGYNRLLGADGQYRLNRSSMLGMHAFFSRTVQDKLSRREDGHAVGADYKYGTRDLRINVMVLDISEAFSTETGYLLRKGVSTARVDIRPKFYPDGGILQRIDLGGATKHTRDKFSHIWESYNLVSLAFTMPRNTHINARFNYSTEVFLGEEFDTSRVRFSGRSQIDKKLFFSLSVDQGSAIFYSADPYQGESQNVSASLRYQLSDKLEATVDYTFSKFVREADNQPIYDYAITRGRLTYQVNKYFFIRGILEYNSFHNELMTDFLASFLYIPGTVVHFGYGSLYERIAWRDGSYISADRFMESHQAIFFKASYLWRL